jgi:hypothetical protein
MPPSDIWSRVEHSKAGRIWSHLSSGSPPLVGPPAVPKWIERPIASTWAFVNSASIEFDVLVSAWSVGTLFIKNTTDNVIHRLYYVGAGLTTSKGPMPSVIGGSYSDTDMWNKGIISTADPLLDYIGLRPDKPTIDLKDFEGFGAIVSVSVGNRGWAGRYDPQTRAFDQSSASLGVSYAAIQFGLPPVAVGIVVGAVHMLPGAGITGMPVYFWLDDDQTKSPFPKDL